MAETAEGSEVTTYLGLRGDGALQKMWRDWEQERGEHVLVVKLLGRQRDDVIVQFKEATEAWEKANVKASVVLDELRSKIEEMQNPKQVGVFERVHVWLFGADVDG